MVSKDILRGILPAPTGKKEIIIRNQTTNDIINEILESDALFTTQYDLIAKYFEGRDDYQTAKNIWQFLRKNVRYVIETDEKQTTCSPALLLQRGTGDCKHYALFSAGILRSLGIPHVFRFASYNILNRDPGHVYVMMGDIAIDAVLPIFNNEKTYIYHVDKKPKKAMLTRMSGFADYNNGANVQRVKNRRPTKAKIIASRRRVVPFNGMRNDTTLMIHGFDSHPARVGSLWGSITHAVQSVVRPVAQAATFVAKPVAQAAKWTGNEVAHGTEFVAKGVANGAKFVGKEALQGAKFVGKTVLKIAGAPVRTAFLICVDFNLLGLAESLYNGCQKDTGRIKNFWEGVGGDWGHLKGSINKGVGGGKSLAGIGIAPAAALALAAPLIAAVTGLLKQLGVGVPKELQQAADKGVQALAAQAQGSGYDSSGYNNTGGGYGNLTQNEGDYGDIDPNLLKQYQTTDQTTSTTSDVPGWVWVAGGAALLLAAKKLK